MKLHPKPNPQTYMCHLIYKYSYSFNFTTFINQEVQKYMLNVTNLTLSVKAGKHLRFGSVQIEFHLRVYFGDATDATVSVSLPSEFNHSLRHMGAPIYILQTL